MRGLSALGLSLAYSSERSSVLVAKHLAIPGRVNSYRSAALYYLVAPSASDFDVPECRILSSLELSNPLLDCSVLTILAIKHL